MKKRKRLPLINVDRIAHKDNKKSNKETSSNNPSNDFGVQTKKKGKNKTKQNKTKKQSVEH